jgi:hypothetical protein
MAHVTKGINQTALSVGRHGVSASSFATVIVYGAVRLVLIQ